ncbi:hypothetical protein C440_09873 [Haloferax mucosum ATCC BAA-1512]|uniref:Transcription regulator TrmB N-terminal domain-containing protein n=1 Tax=Haloferax mucosum ATCC BAA-1512 TaxID=662479 RepID=M0IEJ6_9EURY|nr:hypothetical protein C440_09873 [Haloferax mucosum ATCC BAA-1512]
MPVPPHETAAVEAERSVDPLPETLSSSQTKLVYLYLQLQRVGTVEELRDTLGMKVITLYPVLEHLVDLELVRHEDGRYVYQPT